MKCLGLCDLDLIFKVTARLKLSNLSISALELQIFLENTVLVTLSIWKDISEQM